MNHLSVDNLITIAASGGGFTLDCRGRTTDDITTIAAAASRHKARLTLINCDDRSVNDLITIAAAGKGSVVFA